MQNRILQLHAPYNGHGQLSERKPHEENLKEENRLGTNKEKGRQLIKRLVSIHKFLRYSGPQEKAGAPIDDPSPPRWYY